MLALTQAALPHLPPGITAPGYDRRVVRPGIAHLSVGNFHRAHQAFSIDRLLSEPGHEGWGLLGIGLLDDAGERAKAAAMRAQDGLYTLTRCAADGGITRHVIGAIIEYLHAPDDPEAALARLADPAIRIVTLTITEGGYNQRAHGAGYDLQAPSVVADLASPARPRSAFGFIVEALRRRRALGVRPFTVQSCDNLQENGAVARNAVVSHARALDPALADWIDSSVAFPNSMVDCITPAVGAAERDRLNEASGVADAIPVFSESFLDWVIEDRFCDGRPDLERVGARMVADVHPFERAKLHMLNASHAMLGYPSQLAGIERVDQALKEPLIRRLLDQFMTADVMPMLEQPPGLDLMAYRDLLLARFSNPAVGDQITRITGNGAAKLPVFWGPVLRHAQESNADIRRLAFGVACFLRYLRGQGDHGRRFQPSEPLLDPATLAQAATASASGALGLGLLRQIGVPETGGFADAVISLWDRIEEDGAMQVCASVVDAA